MLISWLRLRLPFIELDFDFKSEYLFRTCSVATNLVTSLDFHSNLMCFYVVPSLANYGTVSYSPIFTPLAALLQAMLQANTEPIRNGQVEMRNRAVRMRNRLRTSPVPVQKVLKRCVVRWNLCFWACKHEFLVKFYLIN